MSKLDILLEKCHHINYIKMDIEGDEINALKGAVGIINKFNPKMMISSYHKTEHLWEIPYTIKNILPQYKIFLGHQPNVPFEPEYYVTL